MPRRFIARLGLGDAYTSILLRFAADYGMDGSLRATDAVATAAHASPAGGVAMRHRPEIDGLRAVAVVPVILFHAEFGWFSGGFVGVDVFFVISGYLITSILVEDLAGGRFSIARFYERRARRILPALFFVLACTTAAAWLWMTPPQLEGYARALVAVVLFVSNIYFWRTDDYFAPAAELNPLLHTWSLAVEEQFYIVFPVLLFVGWRFGARRLLWIAVALSLASLALAQWGSRNAPTPNFFLIPTRAWELGAGAICALLLANAPPRANALLAGLGLALVAASVFAFDAATPFPSVYALAPVGGAALVILYGDARTLVGRLLSLRPMVGIGLISYSVYLWHQPLFVFARIRSMTHPSAEVMLALSAASLVLGYLSWRYVEAPFRRSGAPPLPSRRAVFAASGLAAAGLVGFGVYGAVTDGREASWRPASAKAAQVYDLYETAGLIENVYLDDGACKFNVATLDEATVARLRDCRRRFGPGMAIFGDSHAIDLFNGMYALHGDAFVFGITYWSCQIGARRQPDCDLDRFRRLLREEPGAFRTILYTLAGQRLLTAPNGEQSRDYLTRIPEYGRVAGQGLKIFEARIAREAPLLRAFAALDPSARVIWVGPRVQPHIGLNFILNGGCGYRYALRDGQAELFADLDRRLAAAAGSAGVEYVSLIDAVRFDMAKDFMTCDVMYWRDSDHWSEAGARRFVRRLLAAEPSLDAARRPVGASAGRRGG